MNKPKESPPQTQGSRSTNRFNIPHNHLSAKASLLISRLHLDLMEKEMIIDQRKKYFNISIIAAIAFTSFTVCVILANGLKTKPFDFSVSDKVIIALIGSSSIPSLAVVGKYLFSRSKD